MAFPAPASSYRLTPISILAPIALAFGILGAWQIGPSGRLDLLVVAGGCLAAAIAISQASTSLLRASAAVLVVAAAMLTTGQSLLEVASPALHSLVWIFLSIGIVCWSQDLVGLALFTMVSGAGLSLGFPLLVSLAGASTPSPATQACAAVTAAVAIGFALNQSWKDLALVGDSPRGFPPSAIPRMLLWIAIATFSVVATTSNDPAWANLTVITIASVFLVESLATDKGQSRKVANTLAVVPFLIGLVAIVCAAGLAVVSLALGAPFGWPVAGVAFVAWISLTIVGTESLRHNLQQTEFLKQSARESRVDALTGLNNRRGFDERLNNEVARAGRYGHPLSLIMIDIDDFKQVNDRFGHAAGDATLQSLATLIQDSIRSIDISARYGGEEFVVLLPETRRDGATVVADRICRGMYERSFTIPATVSIGIAELNEHDPSPVVLLHQADEALYRAKRLGKNRVELAR